MTQAIPKDSSQHVGGGMSLREKKNIQSNPTEVHRPTKETKECMKANCPLLSRAYINNEGDTWTTWSFGSRRECQWRGWETVL
jgi:hypothetical protein